MLKVENLVKDPANLIAIAGGILNIFARLKNLIIGVGSTSLELKPLS